LLVDRKIGWPDVDDSHAELLVGKKSLCISESANGQKISMIASAVRAVVASVAAFLATCGQSFTELDETEPDVTDPRFRIVPGLPDSSRLINSPPAPLGEDKKGRKAALPLRCSDRWKIAACAAAAEAAGPYLRVEPTSCSRCCTPMTWRTSAY